MSQEEAPAPSHTRLVPWLIGVGLLALAWGDRFVQDDAFISYRYARNLAEGLGLIWQPGVVVEGYTNFLWTLLLALGLRLGLDPVPLSQGLGLVGHAVTLLVFHRLARRCLGCRNLATLALLLLGTNFTFRAYATGGLETPWQVMLHVLVLDRVVAGLRRGAFTDRERVGLSLLSAVALMLRLDSGLVVLVAGAAVLWCVRAGTRREQLRALAGFVAPMLGLVGAWLAWKLHTYGGVLPNTAYAKLSAETPWGQGLAYLWQFSLSYLVLPFPLLFLPFVRRALSSEHRLLRPLLLFTGLWLLFVVRAGGGFMEFRLLTPALPGLVILGVWTLEQAGRGRRWVRMGLAVLALMGTWNHQRHFASAPFRRNVETVEELVDHLSGERYDWQGIGRTLGELFPAPDRPVIATSACGAIPYFSRLDTVDQLGLNDPWVARQGVPFSAVAGHRRVAPITHLLERSVHLVLGHPVLYPAADLRGGLRKAHLEGPFLFLPDPENLPREASLLFLPVPGDRRLPVLYLTQHPAVERAATRGGWLRIPLGAGP